MKKTTLVFILVALISLLGLTTYTVFLLFGSSIPQQICPCFSNDQINLQDGQVGRTGFDMMGHGMMMGSMGAFVSSEYEFLVHMIPHHEEAVSTAGVLKENTEREEMKSFAENIIRTQSEEIEQMTTWHANWYPDEDYAIDYQPMMRNLENLRGEELDQAFLEDMIPHHVAAVMMSQQLLSRGLAEHEEVAILARNIRNNQRDEIHMMMNWLSEWYGNAQIVERGNGNMMVWIGLIAVIILIVLAVWLFKVAFSGPGSTFSSARQARELLDMRYAKAKYPRKITYIPVRILKADLSVRGSVLSLQKSFPRSMGDGYFLLS